MATGHMATEEAVGSRSQMDMSLQAAGWHSRNNHNSKMLPKVATVEVSSRSRMQTCPPAAFPNSR